MMLSYKWHINVKVKEGEIRRRKKICLLLSKKRE